MTIIDFNVIVTDPSGRPIPGARVTLPGNTLSGAVRSTDGGGFVNFYHGSPISPRNVDVIVDAAGYAPYALATPVDFGVTSATTNVTLTPSFKQAPTRDQVCGINITFQGLTVNTSQFGTLPWFGAALAWLGPQDRATVYRAQHGVGDTHCIVAVPSGRPLYSDPDQPYSPDRFPSLDWTNGLTSMDPAFVNLVVEVIQNGFIPMIFCDEIYDTSIKEVPLVMAALKGHPKDLTKYCLVLPGWDGVFYGWEPSNVLIPGWAATARAIAPNCYLGIEHNIGHIPLGNGGADYIEGGLMAPFDVVLSEFENGTPPADSTWQVVARMVNPYLRPAEQPAGDDPNPPFYLAPGSPRGPYYYCAFEFDEYRWVRGGVDAATIAAERAYLKNLGCQFTG